MGVGLCGDIRVSRRLERMLDDVTKSACSNATGSLSRRRSSRAPGASFNLAALALVAATRIIQLADARDASRRPAADVIDESLIEAAAAIGKTLEGKTARQKNPHLQGSLSWLAWITARLGGWHGYYKPPGPKTIAHGWRRLAAMLDGYAIAHGKSLV